MPKLIEGIFDQSMRGMQRMLDLTYRRNEALTSNIANAETPGYRAVDVDFAKELNQAFGKSEETLLRTNGKHLAAAESQEGAHLIADESGATKADGNNVDIDIQMGRLAYNSGQFSTAAQLMRRQLQILHYALRQQ